MRGPSRRHRARCRRGTTARTRTCRAHPGPSVPDRDRRVPARGGRRTRRGSRGQRSRVAPASDSPVSWVADHIRRYVDSGGRRGHRWSGVNTLLLTTRGRNTGRRRRTALIYRCDGGRYVVVASNGGKDLHPQWYLNLRRDPHVELQVAAERFLAYARVVEGDERERLWQLMAEVWPDYERHRRRTTRTIPVVVLLPRGRGLALRGEESRPRGQSGIMKMSCSTVIGDADTAAASVPRLARC